MRSCVGGGERERLSGDGFVPPVAGVFGRQKACAPPPPPRVPFPLVGSVVVWTRALRSHVLLVRSGVVCVCCVQVCSGVVLVVVFWAFRGPDPPPSHPFRASGALWVMSWSWLCPLALFGSGVPSQRSLLFVVLVRCLVILVWSGMFLVCSGVFWRGFDTPWARVA